MRGGCKTHPVPEQQADATLDQAAPVQSTYYTLLDTTKNARIYSIMVLIQTTNETLQVKITVDGEIWISTATACVAATPNYYYKTGHVVQGSLVTAGAIPYLDGVVGFRYPLEGRSIKVEVQKTTVAGAGNLQGRVVYAKW